MTATNPQTAADAAERVQAALDSIWPNSWEPDQNDVRALLVERHEFLADNARMAAELEQVRSDWLAQTAQLNRIAGIVGHALILRACDDATPEEIRFALAKACEDVHEVIGESEATRGQRTERYLAMCAGLINDTIVRQRDAALEYVAELEQVRDALAVAVELIDRLAFDDACEIDHNGYCQAHNLHSEPCPHPLGRRFVETWDAESAETTATRPADGTAGMTSGKNAGAPQ